MHCDDSIKTVFDAHNTLNNPAIDTPFEILDSEPSPTNYSQPPLVPITPPTPIELSTSISSHTDATPFFPLFPAMLPILPAPWLKNSLKMTSMITSTVNCSFEKLTAKSLSINEPTQCRPPKHPHHPFVRSHLCTTHPHEKNSFNPPSCLLNRLLTSRLIKTDHPLSPIYL